MKKSILFCIILLIPLDILFAQNSPQQNPVLPINTQVKISLTLKDATLNNVMRVLGEKTGLKFIVDPAIQERKITVNLSHMLPADAISAIMKSNNLGYRRIQGLDVYMVSDMRKIMSQTVVKQIPCQFADSNKLQKILSQIVTPGIGAVLSDERTNSLIIKENPEIIEKLDALIMTLDKPTPQIYIQAAIAEISITNDKETGLEWLYKNPNILSEDDRIGTRFNLRPTQNSGQSGGSSAKQYKDMQGDAWAPGLPMGSGLGIGVVNFRIDAVLKAIQTDYNLNVLSRPYLVTLDNQEAIIEVGDQIPYKVLSQYGITSYEFKSASVRLFVRPHINNNNTITVHLRPNADFQNGQTPDGVPIIATRKANTTIKVTNGETIVIGGLMRESLVESVNKVPILGSIPLLGLLFRHKVRNKVKTELVVLITPHIVTEEMATRDLKPDAKLSEKAYKELNKFDLNQSINKKGSKQKEQN